VTINKLYSTNILAVHNVARCIVGHDVDANLGRGSLDAVMKIAPVSINGKTRWNLSFASKYCSWHNSDAYPIYDSCARVALWAYKKQYSFKQFTSNDLLDYLEFASIVAAFRRHFDLESLTLKEVDKFLYVKGYELQQVKTEERI
jgi:hypothetical protein